MDPNTTPPTPVATIRRNLAVVDLDTGQQVPMSELDPDELIFALTYGPDWDEE